MASATTAAAWGASQNYTAQAALGAALASQVEKAWTLLDLTDLKGSSARVSSALAPVVQQHAMASRAFANQHYLSMRTAQGIIEPFLPEGTALPTPEKVEQYVSWAVQPLIDAQTTAEPATGTSGAVEAAVPDVTQLLAPAEAKASTALQKLVSDTGRQQIVDNVMQDRHARGWAREARPDACWFCAMLATRGAVYKSAWAAGRRTVDGVNYNSYHRNCHCQVVPVFQHYEPPAHVRDWQKLWADATKGKSGADKAWAFQEAYLGHPIEHRTDKWQGYGRKRRGSGNGLGRNPKSRDEQVQIAAGMHDGQARKALSRARELYAQEGDPVGDRVSWIRVLEDRLGQPHQDVPEVRNLFDRWDDAQLQEAINMARKLLQARGEPHDGGKRADWIAKLTAEQQRRAVSV